MNDDHLPLRPCASSTWAPLQLARYAGIVRRTWSVLWLRFPKMWHSRDMAVASVAQYVHAFSELADQISSGQRAMLVAHAGAPGRLLSATALAEAAGYKDFHAANLQYGTLGYMVASHVGYTPSRRREGKPMWTLALALASEVRSPEDHFQWELRLEVVEALRQLGWIGRRRETRTLLFTWNPRRYAWPQQETHVRATTATGTSVQRWNCGNRRQIDPGDRVFLMRLGVEPKGLVASGRVVSTPYEGPHWEEAQARTGKKSTFVDLDFDFVSPEPVVSAEELVELGSVNWFPEASGILIAADVVSVLERIWAQRTNLGSHLPPDELDLPSAHVEGALRRSTVNAYERNPAARRACLRNYKAVCYVCEMDFASTYGEYAKGYIHVHHVNPLGAAGGGHHVDAIRDLKPLCPNCHAAIHLTRPLKTPEQMRDAWRGRHGDPGDRGAA